MGIVGGGGGVHIIHAIRILHKDIYSISSKFSKHDKLGIHKIIEENSIVILSLAIESAFKSKQLKQNTLETMRVQIEVLKHLVRTEHELLIIDMKTYIRLSEQLIEISRMTNGWINYITEKSQKI